ncbi:sulfatase-like hydrolase/transferase [Bilophila wadsworthia]|uniref:sulfatase-like hydrolase/transferase n=1 Tax=Bilophila wadsworthia TaxID=35833 RepID=UPI0039908D28
MREKKNVIVVMLDTLQFNYLGYGNTRVKTPNIDRFATEGVVSKTPYGRLPTVPCRRAMLTGRYTAGEGLVAARRQRHHHCDLCWGSPSTAT